MLKDKEALFTPPFLTIPTSPNSGVKPLRTIHPQARASYASLMASHISRLANYREQHIAEMT